MPLQRRVPKFGFRSRIALVSAEIRLGELGKVAGEVVDLEALRKAGLIRRNIKRARVFLSGTVDRAMTIRGIKVTKGARAAIEAAGGSVETAASTPRTARSTGSGRARSTRSGQARSTRSGAADAATED